VCFSNFSRVWQLKTPKTWSHTVESLVCYPQHTNGLESTWKRMDPKLEVGELLMHRSLNLSVDHGCNMWIKMIRFMKGWTVAWIQNKVFRSLLLKKGVNIDLLIHVLCVVMVMASYRYIEVLHSQGAIYCYTSMQDYVCEKKRLLLVAAVHHIWLFVYMRFQRKVFQTWAKEWGCRHEERENLFGIKERRVQHFLSFKGLLDL
jgi:hypothetical protein